MSLSLVSQSNLGQDFKHCGCFCLFVCLPNMNSGRHQIKQSRWSSMDLLLSIFCFWQHPKSYKLWSVGDWWWALLTALSRADVAADKPLVFNHSLVKAFPYIALATTMNCWVLLVSLTWSHGWVDLASRWHSLAAVSSSPVASLPQSKAAEAQLSIFLPQSTDQLAL